MSNQTVPQSDEIKKFILENVAGVDTELLYQCSKSEINKYFSIGVIILCTAIFASFSGGYAAYATFGNFGIAALVGIVWGGFILMVDRVLVSGMRKDPNNNKLTELKQAWIRYLLAILIAIVVSKPLEVRLLENIINKYTAQSDAKTKEFLAQSTDKEYGIAEMQKELATYGQKDTLLNEQLGNINKHPVINGLQNQYSSCEAKRALIQKQIDAKGNESIGVRDCKFSNYCDNKSAYVFPGKRVIDNTDDLHKYLNGRTVEDAGGVKRNVNVINNSGRERIAQIERQIGELRTQKNQYNCGAINSKIQSEEARLTDEVGKEIVENDSIKKAQDSIYQLKKELSELDKEEAKIVVENASSGFIGKFIALEALKSDESYQMFETETAEVDLEKKMRDSINQEKVNILTRFLPTEHSEVFTIADSVSKYKKEIKARYVLDEIQSSNSQPSIKNGNAMTHVKKLSWGLFIFFLLIESMPITIKILWSFGKYDAKLARQEQENLTNF